MTYNEYVAKQAARIRAEADVTQTQELGEALWRCVTAQQDGVNVAAALAVVIASVAKEFGQDAGQREAVVDAIAEMAIGLIEETEGVCPDCMAAAGVH